MVAVEEEKEIGLRSFLSITTSSGHLGEPGDPRDGDPAPLIENHRTAVVPEDLVLNDLNDYQIGPGKTVRQRGESRSSLFSESVIFRASYSRPDRMERHIRKLVPFAIGEDQFSEAGSCR
jgi:hypothetical protein